MRKLSIGVQSFEDLRQNDYVYVDKTGYICNLIDTYKVCFLSRPRRFGKSLFLSTLKAYFEGKKELFRGLKIEKYENGKAEKWTAYPVIYLSFATGNYCNSGELENKIDGMLNEYEKHYQVNVEKKILGDRLVDILEAAYRKTGKKAVVLIDEYDKPLLDNATENTELEEKNRATLKGFYTALKDGDDYLKFAFVTGVSKFSKVSLFSDVNQMKDISMKPEYSAICGITEEELVENYSLEIENMAHSNNISKDDCLGKLRKFYDGYHFCENCEGVFNPFSVLNAFSDLKFGRYWFESGTPTFLINKLKEADYTLENLTDGVKEDIENLKNSLGDEIDMIPLFYQSGYLTIDSFNPDSELYTLKFPNEEVESGFERSLVPAVLKGESSKRFVLFDQMINDLDNGDADIFMKRLRALFASIPYPEGSVPQLEREWRNQVYLVFKMLGQRTDAEVHTSTGRVDCLLQNKKYVYIFEFKKDKTADDAIFQIEDRHYSLAFEADGRTVIKVGSTFLTDKRTFMEWIITKK